MQVGIDSFAAFDDAGLSLNPSERLRRLIEQIEYADKIGLDVFGIGEHHRRDFLDSAPTVILAAAAARTKRIRLTSAVTVLSAADPVRVFQEFAHWIFCHRAGLKWSLVVVHLLRRFLCLDLNWETRNYCRPRLKVIERML